jgi:putative transposase
MITATRYKLYPNKETEDKLFANLNHCSFVYTYCLDNSIWKDNVLPQLKEKYPELKEVHSIVLQNVVHQIRDNVKVLSALKKRGRKVGRLRHKKLQSMIFEQSGFRIENNKLTLSKIGEIPILISRPIEGVIKQIVIKHNKTHKWFACVVSSNRIMPKRTAGKKAVGIDLNVSNFSTDSDGLVIEHPKNVKKAEKRLSKQQQKLLRKRKGSKNRIKQRVIVAKIHEKIESKRNDFLHKISRYYVNNYDLVALEDLNITKLVQISGRGLTKAILDASWDKFVNCVTYKAENAGKFAVQVCPRGTTQDCCICREKVAKDLSERMHSCPYCGSILPRDYNAAQNIKLKGLEKVGWGTPEPTALNTENLNTLAEIRTSILSLSEQVPINESRISKTLVKENVNYVKI